MSGDFGLIFSLATLARAACLIWAGRKLDNMDRRLYSVIVVIGLAVACGAIRSLVSSVSVIGTAISPVLFGWMIDDGASRELIAAICVIWIALAIPATAVGLRITAGK